MSGLLSGNAKWYITVSLQFEIGVAYARHANVWEVVFMNDHYSLNRVTRLMLLEIALQSLGARFF